MKDKSIGYGDVHSVEEALSAAKAAESLGQYGIYPSACVVLARELNRVRDQMEALGAGGVSATPITGPSGEAARHLEVVREWARHLTGEPKIDMQRAVSFFARLATERRP